MSSGQGKKQNDVAALLKYAGGYRKLTWLGMGLSGVAMILGMAPYLCIWLAIRELIAVAPEWTQAAGISRYGWLAFAAAVAGILVYFAALMSTHLAAFRTASNIRKQGMAHLMKTPLGFFDANASGLLRNRLDGAAAETETLLAHNLADIVGTNQRRVVAVFPFEQGHRFSGLFAVTLLPCQHYYILFHAAMTRKAQRHGIGNTAVK